jgi:hypothetical protein
LKLLLLFVKICAGIANKIVKINGTGESYVSITLSNTTLSFEDLFNANALYFDICSLSYNLFALMRQILPLEFAKVFKGRLYNPDCAESIVLYPKSKNRTTQPKKYQSKS